MSRANVRFSPAMSEFPAVAIEETPFQMLMLSDAAGSVNQSGPPPRPSSVVTAQLRKIAGIVLPRSAGITFQPSQKVFSKT